MIEPVRKELRKYLKRKKLNKNKWLILSNIINIFTFAVNQNLHHIKISKETSKFFF